MQNLLPYRDLTYVDKLSPVITEHQQKAITTKSNYAILTIWLALKVESTTSIALHISHISCDKDDNNYDNNRLRLLIIILVMIITIIMIGVDLSLI